LPQVGALQQTLGKELRHRGEFMKLAATRLTLFLVLLGCLMPLSAQDHSGAAAVVVPRLVNYSGKVVDAAGKPASGIAGVTFAIYEEQEGGEALWMETQNVQADKSGRYTVQLGAASLSGLPSELFVSGAARWLGVQVSGQAEPPRTLLLSVPYALKAADAETIGGLPPSAFVRANDTSANVAAPGNSSSAAMGSAQQAKKNPAVTGKGVANYVPVWDSASDIVDSIIFQKGSSIGINTISPAAPLDVNGKGNVRDTLTLFPKGKDSTLSINGTAFNVDQTGLVTFISSQKFPGVGTITGVTAGTDLTGGGSSGKVTLNLDTTKVPQLNAANSFVGNQGVAGNVSIIGTLGIGTTTPAQALDLGAHNNMIIRIDPGNDTSEADGGYALVGRGAGGAPNTWWTFTAPVGGGFGVPVNSYSVWQYPPNSKPGCCLNRFTILPAEASTDTGGTVTIDQNGDISQARTAGGTVKAMLHFSPYNGGKVLSCFNSTLAGAAATAPPCGFVFDITGAGDYIFDFGFEVDDRIYSATTVLNPVFANVCGNQDGQCFHTGSLTNNQVEVTAFFSPDGSFVDTKIYLIVY
jgi:hypothetical protein